MASTPGLAGKIDGYLKTKGSPMAGMGNVFVAAGKKYGVDPRLVVGISGAESSFGKHLFSPHNAWGWGVNLNPQPVFGSWQQSIPRVTRGLSELYISQGLTTPAQIVSKWAPSSDGNDESIWSNNVSTFMRELGALPATTTVKTVVKPSPSTTVPAFTLPSMKAPVPSTAGLRGAIIDNLMLTAQRGHASGLGLLGGVASGMLADRQTDAANKSQYDIYQAALAKLAPTPTETTAAPAPTSTPSTTSPPEQGPLKVGKWVALSSGADRSGVTTHQSVLDAVARIGRQAGEKLTISTGTNHNQFVAGSDPPRESQHWQGNAADIVYGHGTGPDNIDPALTRLGRQALIAAGMDPQQAAKINGGAFNVGGWNILFNTNTGGNHYNHLHVGV